jgi:hypothetical protein
MNSVFEEEYWNRQYAERELGIISYSDDNGVAEIEPLASSNSVAVGSKLFKVCTMSEWPGQSEGEAMDLQHFWQVALMQYPEDHSVEV